MNCYTIKYVDAQAVGTVWAISERAALITWVLSSGRSPAGLVVVRDPDLHDRLGLTREGIAQTLKFLGDIGARNDARYAYKVAHHYARDERNRDPMGEYYGRND